MTDPCGFHLISRLRFLIILLGKIIRPNEIFLDLGQSGIHIFE